MTTGRINQVTILRRLRRCAPLQVRSKVVKSRNRKIQTAARARFSSSSPVITIYAAAHETKHTQPQPPTSETERTRVFFFQRKRIHPLQVVGFVMGESGSGKLFIVASRKHTSVFSMLDPLDQKEKEKDSSSKRFSREQQTKRVWQLESASRT
jgi:hypothetical protein